MFEMSSILFCQNVTKIKERVSKQFPHSPETGKIVEEREKMCGFDRGGVMVWSDGLGCGVAYVLLHVCEREV